MTTSGDALADYDGLGISLEALIEEHDALAAALGIVTTQRDDALARILVLQQDNTAKSLLIQTLTTKVAELEAEIKRLNDIINPPPAEVRVLESYGPPGGGGINLIEGDFLGTDVGAMVRLYPDSWESAKWNLGLGGARHIASLTVGRNGLFYVHGGSPGSQEGVFEYDPVAQQWRGPIAGSQKLYVNSQNSYGDPNSTVPSAWKFGYGTWEQRSVGRLTWMRDNGDLVCGQFGYAGGGKGGVAVLSNGVKRIIPGTENWACRAVQRGTDNIYMVSVEKARVSNTALPTPGGLWEVNVDTGQLIRLTQYPDTPEHIDYIENTGGTVVACRNQGVWRAGQDITFNLPRASEWYSVAINDRGDILAGCMDPQKDAQGRYWSVAQLLSGNSNWTNLTPFPLPAGRYMETLNSAEPFAAVNRANTLGLAGATVTDVAWRGDVPVCSASGIVWAAPSLYMEPAPGSWIIVNRAYDRTPDGYEAFASSDFRAMWRKPNSRWEKAPFSGGNDGADVSWEILASGDHVLHYKGPSGERQAFNADRGSSGAASGTMPPKQPQAAMPAEKRAEILNTVEVQQFGERYGTFAVTEDELIVFGHGGAISRTEQVDPPNE